jgi:hypothetical protein
MNDWSSTKQLSSNDKKAITCLYPKGTCLLQYWEPGLFDFIYTNNMSDMGMSGGGYTFQKIGAVISPTTSTTNLGYTYEKIQCYVSTTQKSGTIPLYRYFA